jgi:AAA15 family ATPase/GTPase
MLCQFSFKNFNSYKNETIFDFQATNVPEFEESCITFEKCSSLLPVSVIYGPNGGGKSNLLKALSCVISLVVQPIRELEKTRRELVFNHKVPYSAFAFDNSSANEPTEFKLYFRILEHEYCYYLALLHNEIVSESLYRKSLSGKRSAMIFEREGRSVSLGSSINKKSINKEVNPKMPYLSFLAINYDIPIIAEVQNWFESCIIRNFANPHVERNIFIPRSANMESRKNNDMFITAMNEMGIDIFGYRFDPDQDEFFLKHIVNGNDYELAFGEESDGTRKIFSALPLIMIAIAEGRLIVVDELDSKLHPKLLRYIISLFTDRRINRNGAQLLFTSHDMSTMRNDVFRRDEIWFAALDDESSSELYSLVEIRNENNQRINNTAAYDKQYLAGRYGADPYLKHILDWEAIE